MKRDLFLSWIHLLRARGLFFACAFAAPFGCAPGSGDFGPEVEIPEVEIQCTTGRCRGGIPGVAYVVYTTSSCGNPTFGQVASENTTVTCTALGCSGRVTGFIGLSGAVKTQIASGVYNLCVEIDFNNNYGGRAQIGEDTVGSLDAVVVREANSAVQPLLTVSRFDDL